MYGCSATLTTATTVIGNIKSITPPKMSRTAIESTHSGSTGGWKTFLPGDIKDGGELEITWQYNTALDYGSLFNTAGCDTLTVTFPKRVTACGASLPTTAASWAASVVLTNLSPVWEMDDMNLMTGTFKVSGAPTYTAAVV